MAKIYLSSTYSDLKEHREAVYHALRKMRHDIIAMEDYVATDQRPLDKCLEDVRRCDLYIGLFAWRYGYIPLENNPEQKSITELEYRTAIKQGKPTLLFLLDEEAPWLRKWTDGLTGEGHNGALILALRQELLRDKLVSTFQGKEDIATVVISAVHDWEKRHHLNTTTDPVLDMRTKYLEQVYQRYSSVKLPIGSPQGLSLHAIFQPLTLRRDPLVVENLTREKRRALLGETSEEYERRQSRGTRDDSYPTAQEVTAKNAEDALKKSHQQRMVVLGGPGTGKTTTLKHLTAQQAREALENPDAPLPIYLSLAALAMSNKSLQRYLIDIVEDMEVDPAYADQLWHDIQHGQAYICLDSLDEVDPKRRSDMIDLVNRKAQEPGNTWIVGSRFTEYKGGQFKAGQFSEWEIEPLSATLRQELACRLFPELHLCLSLTQQELPTAQTFVSTLEQHPRASAWGENPLLFSLAAVVFLQQSRLPASRILLYHYVIEAVLATREADPIRRKILLRMLTELALWVHQQRGRTFTEDDLISFFMEEQRRSWGETNDLTHAVINSGILEIVAHQTYGFRHQTFQEYLAASELARRLVGTDVQLREQAETFIWGKRTYSRWTEVLRMMVGILVQNHGASGLRKASQWIEKLAQQHSSEEGDPGFLSFSLALIVVSELGEIPEWQSSQTVKLEIALLEAWFNELVLSIQRSQSSKTMRLTSLTKEIKHFQESSIDTIFEVIISTLKNKSRSIRKICLDILRLFGPRSINIFLQLIKSETLDLDNILLIALQEQSEYVPLESLLGFLQDTDSSVRSRAIEAIGSLGKHAPFEPLLAALQDTDSSVRGAAVIALSKLEERVPLKLFLDCLQDTDSSIRRAALEAIGNLGERVPLEPFLDCLQDTDSSIRRAAIFALGKWRECVPLEFLLPALQDTNYLIRFEAIRALGKLGEQVPLEPLLAALQDTNYLIRFEAIRALGKLGEQVPLEPLLAALQDTDSLVQREAARVLRQRKDIAIERMLVDEVIGIIRSPYLYRTAIETLSHLGNVIPLNSLIYAIHDTNPFMRQTAVEALRIPGEHTYLEALIEALHDTHSSVRCEAVFSLRNWSEHSPFKSLIVESLLEALHDTDPSVRQAVAVTLGVLGVHAPLGALLNALRDTNANVRSATLTALKFLEGLVPLEPLLDALRDEAPNVRSAALVALGERGKHTPPPLDPLLNALRDADSSVRSAAVTALGNLGIDAPLDSVIDALRDANSSERSAAINALGNLKKRAPLEPLLDALHDADFSVRSGAAIALGKLGDRVPLSPLINALHNKDSNVRRAAAKTLGNLGDRVPLGPLLDALHDADFSVRFEVARTLGKLGDRVPLSPLIDALYDTDFPVRRDTAQALGKLGDRVPLSPLVDTLYDTDFPVRRAAVTGLGNLGNRVPLEPLLETLQDEESVVRRTAIRIIQEREPEALQPLSQEALALLQGNPPGPIFRSIAYSFLADTLGNMGTASPAMLEQLTELLQWPYWRVRMKAAQALGKIRRNIPDEAIRRLLVLQRDTHPHNRAVQNAADDALAEILSLETGIEDD